ncbi:hypothetical protein [Mesorhizobium sp. KR2-14]|uniref:hypothetical protein n=1 Tax=Mesorhizobium sp. KR2-14 TaxID=3156610 RepID=UPI0032B39D11
MRDLAEKWPIVPDWSTAGIDTGGLSVRTIMGLNQILVSGDLETWGRVSGMLDGSVGALSVAQGSRYAVRIARDRILAVSETPLGFAPGWHGRGFAVSVIDAGMQVIELSGADVPEVFARGTTLYPQGSTPTASLLFAGANALVYRYGSADRMRIHLDRGLAPYLWQWLEQTVSHL